MEEMLISRILPIMSLYRLPHGQYSYSGHGRSQVLKKGGAFHTSELFWLGMHF